MLANLPAGVYAVMVMKVTVLMLVLIPLLLIGERLRADPAALSVMEGTFKLFNRDSTATCFLLHGEGEPREVYLVTAAHVLEKATGEEAILVLRDARPDGTYVRRDVPFKIRKGDRSLWTKHGEEDVAAMREGTRLYISNEVAKAEELFLKGMMGRLTSRPPELNEL